MVSSISGRISLFFSNFSQDQAYQVDKSATVDVHDAGARHFLRQLLGDHEHGFGWDHRDGRKAVIHLTAPGPRSNPHLLLASQHIFRFHLLDIYSQALGLRLSPEDMPAVVPRMERPPCEGRRLELVGFSLFLFSSTVTDCLSDLRISPRLA
jgi:hypothetical protein